MFKPKTRALSKDWIFGARFFPDFLFNNTQTNTHNYPPTHIHKLHIVALGKPLQVASQFLNIITTILIRTIMFISGDAIKI